MATLLVPDILKYRMAIPVFRLLKALFAFKTFLGRSCPIRKLCMFGKGRCISPYRVTNGYS